MERKGFLTPEQEQMIDSWVFEGGVADAIDGIALQLLDNQGLEKLKEKVPEDVLPHVYEVIDELLPALEIDLIDVLLTPGRELDGPGLVSQGLELLRPRFGPLASSLHHDHGMGKSHHSVED